MISEVSCDTEAGLLQLTNTKTKIIYLNKS